jgi:hypothetical protein
MITLSLEEYEAELLKKSINLSLDAYRNEDADVVCEDCSVLEKLLKKL